MSRWILALSLVVLWGGSTRAAEKTDAKRPNIIVIVSDDMGYSDLGFQGGRDVATPNLDGLAKGGVRFSNAYVTCPVCSPTRAGILSGRYQQRFGHEFNPQVPARVEPHFGLPLSETLLPALLEKAGYQRGMVGKWHLGYREGYLPPDRGFQSWFGFPGGSHSYVDANADGINPIMRNRQRVDEKAYLTDAFGREASEYVRGHAGSPFFLYLTFNAVHTPLQATEKYLERVAKIENPKRKTYLAMLAAMDDAVGRVVEALREKGALDNTLIFFTNDNGGPGEGSWNGSDNKPLRGYKTQVWEGGVRVPLVMHWPARLPAGKVYDKPVVSLDIAATTLAAAGAKASEKNPLDGVDLVPFVTGKDDGVPHEAIYWRYGEQSAIRSGNWKLVKMPNAEPQLYDLAADISESHDLAGAQPERVKALQETWGRWNAQLAEPLWGGARAARRAASASAPAKRRQ